ncbi:MAG: hypothetical protein ACK56K_04755, partial [Akkermansiaceae bacterium]
QTPYLSGSILILISPKTNKLARRASPYRWGRRAGLQIGIFGFASPVPCFAGAGDCHRLRVGGCLRLLWQSFPEAMRGRKSAGFVLDRLNVLKQT